MYASIYVYMVWTWFSDYIVKLLEILEIKVYTYFYIYIYVIGEMKLEYISAW